MICLDNSEWMRNGDYTPNRFVAQRDAATLVGTAKLEANPMSSVGLISMAGKSPEMLVTLSKDTGTILNALAEVTIKGKCNFVAALQVAYLALRHKQEIKQRQRIIMFVASPIEEEAADLKSVAAKLKKSNVAVDVISFGEIDANKEKLELFRSVVNTDSDNSHLIEIPPGPSILSDVLVSYPVIFSGEDGPAESNGGAANGNEFGVDATLDPELAFALRASLAEEQERRAALAAAAAGGSKPDGDAGAAPESEDVHMADAEDDDLAQALAMSMAAAGGSGGDSKAEASTAPAAEEVDFESLTEEQQMAYAMQLSMAAASAAPAEDVDMADAAVQEEKKEEAATDAPLDEASLMQEAMQDPNFMNSLFASLQGATGVDQSDPLIQEALKELKKKEEDK